MIITNSFVPPILHILNLRECGMILPGTGQLQEKLNGDEEAHIIIDY